MGTLHKPQVERSKYSFDKYYTEQRWQSLWHQIAAITRLAPASVLEIGPAMGVVKAVLACFGIEATTVDIADDLGPDHLASVTELPFAAGSYDCVCAFQVLEHLPYEESMHAFREMVRVARRYVLISLPDARRTWNYRFHIPMYGPVCIHLKKPQFGKRVHVFDGEHYWEVNKHGYAIEKVTADMLVTELELLDTYGLDDYPYHRYWIFRKRGEEPQAV